MNSIKYNDLWKAIYNIIMIIIMSIFMIQSDIYISKMIVYNNYPLEVLLVSLIANLIFLYPIKNYWRLKQIYYYKLEVYEEYLYYKGLFLSRKIRYKKITNIELDTFVEKHDKSPNINLSCIKITIGRKKIYCYCSYFPQEVVEQFISNIKYNTINK